MIPGLFMDLGRSREVEYEGLIEFTAKGIKYVSAGI